MKVYTISFDPYAISQYQLVNYLDQQPAIIRNWYIPFTGTVLIASTNTLLDLTNFMSSIYPSHTFLISEISANNAVGRLQPNAWEFINQPKSSGRWEYLSSSGTLASIPPPFPSTLATALAGLNPPRMPSSISDMIKGLNPTPNTPSTSLGDLLKSKDKK